MACSLGSKAPAPASASAAAASPPTEVTSSVARDGSRGSTRTVPSISAPASSPSASSRAVRCAGKRNREPPSDVVVVGAEADVPDAASRFSSRAARTLSNAASASASPARNVGKYASAERTARRGGSPSLDASAGSASRSERMTTVGDSEVDGDSEADFFDAPASSEVVVVFFRPQTRPLSRCSANQTANLTTACASLAASASASAGRAPNGTRLRHDERLVGAKRSSGKSLQLPRRLNATSRIARRTRGSWPCRSIAAFTSDPRRTQSRVARRSRTSRYSTSAAASGMR